MNKKGFTLVELLAVTIILIIITTIVIFTVNKQMEKSRLNAFLDEANVFAKAAQQKYSTDRTTEAISEDLFHNAIKGKVCYSIEQQLLGKYVEIEHEYGYKTMYYSLSETNVTNGSKVVKGDVIGVSGTNKIDGTHTNNLLFESYQNGYLMDPEEFYNVDFSNQN